MALLNEGYWHTNYWPDSYWDVDYWQEYVAPTETIRIKIISAIDTRFKTIVTEDVFNSIRQRIIDAADTQFKTILIAGGYKMNLGSNVFAWRSTPIQKSELPALVYRDRIQTKSEEIWGYYLNEMQLEIEIYAESPAQIRECLADIEKSIYTDTTWGNLALISTLLTDEVQIEQKEDIFVATQIILIVQYLTIMGDPYSQ
jgi:hypothetical protein